MFPVFLDACVLYKSYPCDTVLTIAETGVYRPLWSSGVLVELERAVVDQDTFLLDQLDLAPGLVIGSLRRQVSRYRREPRAVDELLTLLAGEGHGCPRFARACRERM